MIKSLKTWYPKLRSMDMVVCGGGRVIPSSMIIRRVTAGRKKTFDRSISVHTGLVVEWEGQLFIAQMLTNRGLSVDSMETLVGKRKRFILGFRRSKVFDDAVLRDAAQGEIAYMYRKTLDYDFPGLFEFISQKAKDKPGKYYCSEFVRYLTAMFGCKYPRVYSDKVSPYQLQHCDGWRDL